MLANARPFRPDSSTYLNGVLPAERLEGVGPAEQQAAWRCPRQDADVVLARLLQHNNKAIVSASPSFGGPLGWAGPLHPETSSARSPASWGPRATAVVSSRGPARGEPGPAFDPGGGSRAGLGRAGPGGVSKTGEAGGQLIRLILGNEWPKLRHEVMRATRPQRPHRRGRGR